MRWIYLVAILSLTLFGCSGDDGGSDGAGGAGAAGGAGGVGATSGAGGAGGVGGAGGEAGAGAEGGAGGAGGAGAEGGAGGAGGAGAEGGAGGAGGAGGVGGAGGTGGAGGATDPGVVEIAMAAEELDRICAEDCAKDLMCYPDEADEVAVCVEYYCDYREQLADAIADAELLGCLQADQTLSRCVVALSCEDYAAYYNEEAETDFPCETEYLAYEEACAGFEVVDDEGAGGAGGEPGGM